MDGIDGEDFFRSMSDDRNVKGLARSRGKLVCMVSKSYSHKAIKKITYAKEQRMMQDKEKAEGKLAEKERMKIDAEWTIDPAEQKRIDKLKAKKDKAEGKKHRKKAKEPLLANEVKMKNNKHK